MTARSFEATCVRLADEALASGEVATDGDLIAVPDVKLVEFAAQGHDVQPAPRLVRGDGRTVHFYRWPGSGA